MDDDLSGCVIIVIVIAAIIGILAVVITYIDYVAAGGLYLLALLGFGKKFLKLFNKYILTPKSKKTIISIGISSVSISTIILLSQNLPSEFIPAMVILLSLPLFLIFSIVSLESWGKLKTKYLRVEKKNEDRICSALESDMKRLNKEIESEEKKANKMYEKEITIEKQNMDQKETDIAHIESKIDAFKKSKGIERATYWQDHQENWSVEFKEKSDEEIRRIRMKIENIPDSDRNNDKDGREFKSLLLQKEEYERAQNKLREKTKKDEYDELLNNINNLKGNVEDLEKEMEKHLERSLEIENTLLHIKKNKIKLD